MLRGTGSNGILTFCDDRPQYIYAVRRARYVLPYEVQMDRGLYANDQPLILS